MENCSLIISQVPSQARCLEKVKLVPLALALVGVSPWVEVEADSLDHLVLEETASLGPLGLAGRHHTFLVSLWQCDRDKARISSLS